MDLLTYLPSQCSLLFCVCSLSFAVQLSSRSTSSYVSKRHRICRRHPAVVAPGFADGRRGHRGGLRTAPWISLPCRIVKHLYCYHLYCCCTPSFNPSLQWFIDFVLNFVLSVGFVFNKAWHSCTMQPMCSYQFTRAAVDQALNRGHRLLCSPVCVEQALSSSLFVK